jgi:CheY-like chemotaxis protein
MYRAIAVNVLRSAGFRVDEAVDGEAGLVAAVGEPPDLILLDMTMPGIDGVETCRRLKAAPVTSDVPVIFVSANDETARVVEGFGSGASDYVTKPFRPEELLARVRAHVRLKLLQDERLRLYRLLEDELARAGRIQADLLPRDPLHVPGFDFAGHCIPARDVGGDFYDWYRRDDGDLTLTLGDVMGKGMPAALLMTAVRAALRAGGHHLGAAGVLDQVQGALGGDLDRTSSYVTLFHARIAPGTGLLTYVDAGHGHAFVRRADGTIDYPNVRSMPLGIPFQDHFAEGRMTLRPNDALVVYSDGVLEALPDVADDPSLLAAELVGANCATTMVQRLIQKAGPGMTGADDLTVAVVCATSSKGQ